MGAAWLAFSVSRQTSQGRPRSGGRRRSSVALGSRKTRSRAARELGLAYGASGRELHKGRGPCSAAMRDLPKRGIRLQTIVYIMLEADMFRRNL